MLKYTTLKGFKLGIDMVQLMFKEITLAVVDGLEVDKIRSLLQSEMTVGGLRWQRWR